MTDILLLKIAKSEIDLDSFKNWILSKDNNVDFECSPTAFLSYFLNFIHEEILGTHCKSSESPLKCTPRKISTIKSDENGRKRPSLTNKSLEKSFSEVSVDGNSSTPKMLRIQSNSESNACYYSPISPLYKNKPTFATPKTQKVNVSQKSPFCLGDFIVNKKSSSKKKSNSSTGDVLEESSRRITPTCISQVKSSESFRKTSNSFANFNTTEMSVNSPVETRNSLAVERLKILSRNTNDNKICENRLINSKLFQRIEIVPYLGSVTFKEQLDNLAAVYITIINNNLVLNITSEIYFLISLLLSKRYSNDSLNDSPMGVDFLSEEDKNELDLSDKTVQECSDFFSSIHNIVYFSVRCLKSQLQVLKHYDKTTLKLLALNERLRIFSPKFANHLNKLSEMKDERVIETASYLLQTNVCFNLDTDNRENFPSNSSFQSFKKQRDLFYEILRVWEVNHMLDRWDFSIGLGGRIKALFSLDGEPANFMHFSRLFKAQLLSTSQTSQKEQGISEEQLPFLLSLPSIDKEKLHRLKNRLVEKNVTRGLNSPPQFAGYQAFYRDFILEAKNHCFNRHLCDTLIYEIVELNSNKFGFVDLDDTDTQVDTETRKSYFLALKNLRILAKFLGFIESLPYNSDTPNVPENLLNSNIRIRSQSIPSFDLTQCLATSVKQNTVVLTVPWTVEYLAMLDHVTLRLPCYVSVHRALFHLHRCYEGAEYNVALVRFSLGWLFELPHFPDGEYFDFQRRDDLVGMGRVGSLDFTDVVDGNILYDCCPFLTKIKELLASSSVQNTVTVKHITPVTTSDSAESLLKRRSEQLLEDAFFNGQPASLRKTVEFVSERIASACVKHICNDIVPSSKKNALDELKVFLESWINDGQVVSPAKGKTQKAQLKSQVTQMAQKQLSTLLDRCKTEVTGILCGKIPPSIDSLLAIDTLPQTKNACVSISAKICKERIKQWMNAHVTLSIFTKDFESEVQKTINTDGKKAGKEKPIFALPSGGNKDSHDDRCLSGFHLLEKIKLIFWKIRML
ncbi:unnamed protein product [Phaedon cochleariae]|uniref:Codanin-1 C-terminal domain-containing protein n=1 Tax=Phaedon cochleariae TaxID=80249 RepID=A0A9N9SAC6_PHACE|nr:unnamed protein product [Phaedon cochleariae]